MSVDLMDASPDGALAPARPDPLSEHALLILVGAGRCGANGAEVNRFSEQILFISLPATVQIRCICITLPEMFNHSAASHFPLPPSLPPSF